MLMKYIAGLQKSYLRIFNPPRPLRLLFSLVFHFFFNRKTLNNFSGKLIGFFRSLPLKSCISAKNACTQLILGSLKGNFMHFYGMVLTPYHNMVPYYRDVHIYPSNFIHMFTNFSNSNFSAFLFFLNFRWTLFKIFSLFSLISFAFSSNFTDSVSNE